jgi:NAD(P) transhydrogenase subunit beta
MKHNILEICYLIGSITFIVGLKMMGNAKTARKGNLIAAVGMIIAIFGTIFLHDNEVSPIIYGLIFGAIGIGTVIGWMTAKKVQMTKL